MLSCIFDLGHLVPMSFLVVNLLSNHLSLPFFSYSTHSPFQVALDLCARFSQSQTCSFLWLASPWLAFIQRKAWLTCVFIKLGLLIITFDLVSLCFFFEPQPFSTQSVFPCVFLQVRPRVLSCPFAFFLCFSPFNRSLDRLDSIFFTLCPLYFEETEPDLAPLRFSSSQTW